MPDTIGRTDGGTERDGWQVGTATEVITPEQSMWMAGLNARDGPSQGTAEDLRAKAVAFEDAGGNRAVLVGLDLIFVPRSLREAVECRCAEAHGLSPESLLISASHTHAGPEFTEWRAEMYGVDDVFVRRAREYTERLEGEIPALVGEALAGLTPATVSYSHARCGIAMNRRRPTEDGVEFAQNPDGPVDHHVPVLAAESDGDLHAVIFGYACHALTVFFTRFCSDWPGFAQRYIEEAHPEATALFVQGCEGDQHAYPQRSLDLARQHGRSMANAVERALDAQRRPVRGSLGTALDRTSLEFDGVGSRDELESWLESDDEYLRRRARLLLGRLEEGGTIPTEYDYPVQAIGFGDDLTLLALAGEPVVDYSLRLKRELPGSVWVGGCANEDFTYVPTARVLHEGGYESCRMLETGFDGPIQHFQFPGPLHPSVEERIVSTAHDLFARVSGN